MASAFRHITPNEAQTPLGRRRRQRYTPLSSSHAYSRENTHARAEPQDGPSEAFAGASSSSPALPPPMRDRYIPVRGSMDIQVSAFEVEKAIYSGSQHEQEVNASPAKEEYKKCLASNLFGGEPANRVLSFASPRSPSSTAAAAAAAAASTADGCDDTLRMLYNANRHGSFTHREAWGGRHIPQSPERILDAPELLDDYYLNLLDWNADNILGAPSHTPAWARLPPPSSSRRAFSFPRTYFPLQRLARTLAWAFHLHALSFRPARCIALPTPRRLTPSLPPPCLWQPSRWATPSTCGTRPPARLPR